MKIINKLKLRWGIESTYQVIIILIVFSCTGFSALYAKEFIFGWLGITSEYPFWQRAIIWVLTILPVYNVLLYLFGIIFGQRVFFTLFIKKTLGRLIPASIKRNSTNG